MDLKDLALALLLQRLSPTRGQRVCTQLVPLKG